MLGPSFPRCAQDTGGFAPAMAVLARALEDTWLLDAIEKAVHQARASGRASRTAGRSSSGSRRARASLPGVSAGPLAVVAQEPAEPSEAPSRALAAAAVPSLDAAAGFVRYGDSVVLRSLASGARHVALLGTLDDAGGSGGSDDDEDGRSEEASLAAFLKGDGGPGQGRAGEAGRRWSETVTSEGPGLGRDGEVWEVLPPSGVADAGSAGRCVPAGAPVALRCSASGRFVGVDPLHLALRCRAAAPGPPECFQLCTPGLLASVTGPREDGAAPEEEADAVLGDIARSLGASAAGGGGGGVDAAAAGRAADGSALVRVPYSAPLLLRSVHVGSFVAVAPGPRDETPVVSDLSRPPRASAGHEAEDEEARAALARSGVRAGHGSGASAFGLGLDGDGPRLMRSPRKAARGGGAAASSAAPSAGARGVGALLPVEAAFRFAVIPAGTTFTPTWALSRPFLSGASVLSGPELLLGGASAGREGGPRDLGAFVPEQQERLLAGDVIDAFLGHAGRYVVAATGESLRAARAGVAPASDRRSSARAAMAAATGEGLEDVSFVLARCRGADSALLGLARKLLPSAAHAARSRRFVELQGRPEAGLAAQALAGAVGELLHELGLLLTQVEAAAGEPGALPALQRLGFYLQPAAATLRGLDAVVSAAGDARGGALLDRVAGVGGRAGDASTSALCRFLLERAAAPFLRQVESWVFRGELVDDHGLFMVSARRVEPQAGRRAADTTPDDLGWWSHQFEVSPEQSPAFLRPHAALILTAGRNVAALRRCASDVSDPADAAAAAVDLAALAEGRPAGGGDAEADPARRALAALTSAGPTAAALAAASGSAAAALSRADDEAFAARERALAPGATLSFSSEPRSYEGPIRGALERASRALLRHVTDRCRLDAWLASMRRYFLLAQGDFVCHFLDSAAEELERPADPKAGLSLSLAAAAGAGARKPVSLQRLRSLLELSLRTSSAASSSLADDPARDLLSCDLEESRLVDRLHDIQAAASAAAGTGAPRPRRSRRGTALCGHDAIALRVDIPWPVSLVLSPPSLLKYRMLFRHLFACKLVERKLSAAWSSLQECKELSLRRELAHAHALRARMHTFVRNLVYYMTVEAIEPLWSEMRATIAEADSVDAVAEAHERFLDTALKECLLTSLSAFKDLDRLVALCAIFADRLVMDIENQKPDEEDIARLAGLGTPLAARRRRDGSTGQRAGAGAAAAGFRGLQFVPLPDDEDRASAAAARRSREQHRRRVARVAAQSESMRHTMGQAGWRGVIVRASDMFDSLLDKFMACLLGIASREYKSRLVHLVTRLDFNGFYAGRFEARRS